MKIGMFTDTYFPQLSGVSTSIKILTKELRARGHEVVIFTTTDPNAEAEADVVRISSIPFLSFSDRRIAYRGFDRCLKIARSMNLDIIHTHTEFSMGLAGKYVANRLRIPNIHTYHTMYENYTHYILDGLLVQASHVRVISRQYCNQSNAVIAPSQLTKDTLRSYGIHVPIKIIATGVNIPTFKPEEANSFKKELGFKDDDRILLSLSRLSKEKNILEVLQAFCELKENDPRLKLVIAGDGPERENLEQFSRKHELDVRFVGFVDHEEVWRYYQMADLYLNASESESQGLTYLEAIVNRCPIIAKSNDYLKTVMQEEAFGKLYTEEYPMVEATKDFLERVDSNQMRPINPENLYEISAEKFGDQVLAFYQEIIERYIEEENGIFDRVFGKVKNIIREIVIGGKV
ncbi:glycosyltransferase family 4 protein [Facklamia miroungae]|uniref:1,2-diacylglycerol 3-alpha-glucosyltransferase n=1 Tax=Facklamia miroungae TaxID=120956 RepID=A0A1G7UJ10_9LACT|nr:glycosyltransferase family 4 protein [Facklamia miroungae]NKZ30083.1 glycosyltransferase family 4 protein [Facklamia miroungae]SDG47526.1 1,2-diacylglycerol 3-alpha-glucosyltransferase [Facklamia miroungae]